MLAEATADDGKEGLVVGDEGCWLGDGRRCDAFVEVALLEALIDASKGLV